MRVLVTGGAGYIGSIIVEELLRNGDTVLVVDNLSKGHRAAVLEGAILTPIDLARRDDIADLMRRHEVEVVVHLAADSLVGESMQRPATYFRNNVANSLSLLEAMLQVGVTRFVFSSTAAVYGESTRMPIGESDPVEPTSVYGESKLMVERMLRWFDKVRGLRSISLRYFNAAGATERLGEDHDPETHLIPLVLRVPLGQQTRVQIYGDDYPTPDGTAMRDYVHVVDLAHAHVLALQALMRPAASSAIYNLGSGRGYSVLEIVNAARCITGHPIPAAHVPRRPGDPAKLVASSDQIEQELGWKRRFLEIDDIVASAWEWHRRHPHGYAT